MKRIIFLDVDGTLVDYQNRLPASAVRAIRAARERGHRVYICTGRSRAEVYPELWEIGLDGMIGGNGSYVEDRGQVVLHQTLSAEQCRRAVDWLHGRKLEFYLESNNGLFASEDFEKASLGAIRSYMGRKGREGESVTLRSVFPNMIFGGPLYRSDVNKLSFLLGSGRDLADAEAAFPDLAVSSWGGAGQEALFGSLGLRHITKARAIRRLLEHLGARQADTVAFGDAAVDVPMFEFCAVSVCMGNGDAAAKKAADLVTESVEADGLARGFVRLGLIAEEDAL